MAKEMFEQGFTREDLEASKAVPPAPESDGGSVDSTQQVATSSPAASRWKKGAKLSRALSCVAKLSRIVQGLQELKQDLDDFGTPTEGGNTVDETRKA